MVIPDFYNWWCQILGLSLYLVALHFWRWKRHPKSPAQTCTGNHSLANFFILQNHEKMSHIQLHACSIKKKGYTTQQWKQRNRKQKLTNQTALFSLLSSFSWYIRVVFAIRTRCRWKKQNLYPSIIFGGLSRCSGYALCTQWNYMAFLGGIYVATGIDRPAKGRCLLLLLWHSSKPGNLHRER